MRIHIARLTGVLDVETPVSVVPDGVMRPAEVAAGSPLPHVAAGAPRVAGKSLYVGGERFLVKGVTYGTFRLNEEGEPYPPIWQVRDDFARMRDAGINTVRLYMPPSDRIADAAYAAGLYLLPDICWGPRTCEWDYAEWWRKAVDGARREARRLGSHPAVLMLSIGNEIPPLVVRWYGRERTERRLRELSEAVRQDAPGALVTYVNHPPTEYLRLPFLDVVSFNVYLEREPEFRAYLGRLQTLAGDRPLLLAELGRDSRQLGEDEQRRCLEWQLRGVFEKGLCGAAVYAWTDEWTIAGAEIRGWSFGITTADRRPKPALLGVRDVYRSELRDLRGRAWPRVSVVVAVYNGAATLEQCLIGLSRLDYPDFEVIVVDDGSTDATPDIIARRDVRAIRVPNGGLSRARNLGIEAATGEIVAFIDSDACPPSDWLYHLVCAIDEREADAVGGPNVTPPDAGFVEHCVDCAPGNPTHVLLDDDSAEHVPGCNMAYRVSVLREIGMFDPTHRAAGDDVDVCWKLLVRGRRIAFSPSGLVYHHRRDTVRGYLRQQEGYGYAEAHLQRRYPGRYNVFGHQVWRGNIYDAVSHGLRGSELPLVFRSRVYQGVFGGGQFQSIYQPFQSWWFQIFTTVEWQVLTAAILAAGVLGWPVSSAAAGVLALGVFLLGASLASACLCAWRATGGKRWTSGRRARALPLVAALHLLQPLARARGRLRGWRASRASAPRFPATQRLYGNLRQRSQLLDGLQSHLRACGWLSRPAGEWSEHDVEIPGPGPYRLFVTTVHEDDIAHGTHYVRYRVTTRIKWFVPPLAGAALVALAATLATPWLVPLAVPIGAVSLRLATARRALTGAVSQLVEEYGAVIGMPKARDDF